MVEINPETQKSRGERLATVIAIGASALFHLFVLVGGIQFYHWVEEEEQKERLMVIRRIQETSPEPARASRQVSQRRPSQPDAQVKEEGPEPPPGESSISEEMAGEVSDIEEGGSTTEEKVSEEAISVVTDLSSATFTVSGTLEFHGTGTFWTRKGIPEGKYTITFHPVPGYRTPPVQTKELPDKGSLVFVGKYTRSTEVQVATNVSGASFEILRPDGSILGMNRPGRAFFENLPLGSYSITFHDVPGYLTPSPQRKTLKKGGDLNFVGSYLPGALAKVEKKAPVETVQTLDRRVQMVVKSYPFTSIEENFDYIRYPGIIFQKSDFQQGWCRVYLVLNVNSSGQVTAMRVERPRAEEEKKFRELIATVKSAVSRWQYDRTQAEVHVDVRFYVE